ncbi:MAG: hypothetical protein Greene071436_85 [Parcubacteria group bacterium Greene0714_36]|nr:MAG: hypothetical protein Greene071436_85 [Parcubacteria group bacterium Greene0714_36]
MWFVPRELLWYRVRVIFTAVIKVLWKFGINLAALILIGWILVPAIPHDYLTLIKVAGVLALVNYFF